MTDTAFTVPKEKAGRIARALPIDPVTGQPQSIRDQTQPWKFECGGGCLTSTALDYLSFAQMLLNRGTLDGTRVLGRKTVEYMTADHLGPEVDVAKLHNFPVEHIDGYGFGLGVAVRRVPGVAGIMGSPGDFRWSGAQGTLFWVDPKEELAVVYMAQTPGADPRALPAGDRHAGAAGDRGLGRPEAQPGPQLGKRPCRGRVVNSRQPAGRRPLRQGPSPLNPGRSWPTHQPHNASSIEPSSKALSAPAVWTLAWPTMLQNVIAGLQGIIDHAMVGHIVGFTGNAAIGVSWQIVLVIIVFISSLFTGMGVLVSRFAGANEPDKVNRVVYQAFLTAVFLSIFLAVDRLLRRRRRCCGSSTPRPRCRPRRCRSCA